MKSFGDCCPKDLLGHLVDGAFYIIYIHPLDVRVSVLPATRPYLAKLVRKTSKSLRKKLARKAKKSSKPMVRKTISKSSGRTQVSISQIYCCGHT